MARIKTVEPETATGVGWRRYPASPSTRCRTPPASPRCARTGEDSIAEGAASRAPDPGPSWDDRPYSAWSDTMGSTADARRAGR